MMMTNDLLEFNRYLLVIPHPDDEVNCCALLSRVISRGKNLDIVLITNGDAGKNSELRIHEMKESLVKIGFNLSQLRLLNISEHALLNSFSEIHSQLQKVVTDCQPDCLITLDFEGGHEGHDASNFLAHLAINTISTQHIVYPDYHFRDLQRYGLEFQPKHQPDFILDLTNEEKELKISLLESHAGQIGTYLRIQKNQENYFKLLLSREIYRNFPSTFDYLVRPEYVLGYEHHRNGFKFADFKQAASKFYATNK